MDEHARNVASTAGTAEEPVAQPLPRGPRWPLVSGAYALACIGAFAYEVLRFGWEPNSAQLHVLGGPSDGSLQAGRWWSALATAVLHGNLAHLLLNLVALMLLGVLLERSHGRGITLLVMVVGAAGSAAGVLLGEELVTVGASGVIAAMAGFGITQRPRVGSDGPALRAIATSLVALEAVSYLDRGAVDQLVGHIAGAAHLGGLVAGAALGAVLRIPILVRPTAHRIVSWAGSAAGCAFAAALCIGAAPMIAASAPRTWDGPGFGPAPDPSLGLVERVLDGNVVDTDLDGTATTVVDPRCRPTHGDDRVLRCSIRAPGAQRRATILVDRSSRILQLRTSPAPSPDFAARAAALEFGLEDVRCTTERRSSTRRRSTVRYGCRGRLATVPLVLKIHFDDSGSYEFDPDFTASAQAAITSVGVRLQSGAHLRMGNVRCDETGSELLQTCTGLALGRARPVRVAYDDRLVASVEDIAKLYDVVPTIAAQAEGQLVGLRMTNATTGTSGQVTNASCKRLGSSLEEWSCKLVFDGGRPDPYRVTFLQPGTTPGGDSLRVDYVGFALERTRYFSSDYRPSINPSPEADARAVAPSDVRRVQRQLLRRTFTHVADARRSARVTAADCTAAQARTVEPDFSCMLSFDDGTTERHGVDPQPLQSLPDDITVTAKEFVRPT